MIIYQHAWGRKGGGGYFYYTLLLNLVYLLQKFMNTSNLLSINPKFGFEIHARKKNNHTHYSKLTFHQPDSPCNTMNTDLILKLLLKSRFFTDKFNVLFFVGSIKSIFFFCDVKKVYNWWLCEIITSLRKQVKFRIVRCLSRNNINCKFYNLFEIL